MPRVRLRVWQSGPTVQYNEPDRPDHFPSVPPLRVIAHVLLGVDPAPGTPDTRQQVTAIIDTGHPFNLIDGDVWELFDRRGLIEPLQLPTNPPPLSVAGHASIPYQLGRIRMSVIDPAAARSKLPAVAVICQLLNRRIGFPHPIILGLSEGILDGRWLIREPVAPVKGPENRYDIGPRLGQQWWLQDHRP